MFFSGRYTSSIRLRSYRRAFLFSELHSRGPDAVEASRSSILKLAMPVTKPNLEGGMRTYISLND
ncbi:hypothetical protein Kim5_CH00260 [Rhizobium sp. Kim5]|nr:hypothetical protein Kim5_CH00260 [Rhizobium sp. Kim5]